MIRSITLTKAKENNIMFQHCHPFTFMWLKMSNFKSSWACNGGIKQKTPLGQQEAGRGQLTEVAVEITGRRNGLMVSALNSRASSLGSSPGWEHCVVFLGKTLYSPSASLHPGV